MAVMEESGHCADIDRAGLVLTQQGPVARPQPRPASLSSDAEEDIPARRSRRQHLAKNVYYSSPPGRVWKCGSRAGEERTRCTISYGSPFKPKKANLIYWFTIPRERFWHRPWLWGGPQPPAHPPIHRSSVECKSTARSSTMAA